VRPEFVQEIRQGLVFDIRIVHPNVISPALGHCTQIRQAQVGRGPRVDRQPEHRID